MNVRFEGPATHSTSHKVVLQSRPSCPICGTHGLDLCPSTAGWGLPPAESIQIEQSIHTVPARRIICREKDLHDVVPLVCSGWAVSLVMLSDGSRQILSFLLPGDLISTALLFEPRPHCVVEAVTDVRYRTFNRSQLKGILPRFPDLFDKFSKAWVEEKHRADQLIVDLGRRTADERIARLILDLAERLARNGMTRADAMPALEMDFPLRQHHIADATGLTPVHVSKVLSTFRRSGLIRISERSLTVLDQAGLKRVAHMR